MFNKYILILVWTGYAALLQRSFYCEEYNKLTGAYDRIVKPSFAFLVMIPLIWMAAVRGYKIGDTAAYRDSFSAMPTSIFELPSYIATTVKDRGFSVLSVLIKCVVGDRVKLYFALIALIQAVCLSKTYRKYAINYAFAIFLFVASTDYVAWMHNGLRQFLAVAIVFAAAPLMLEKKHIPLLIVILLASTIHRTAILMIPLVFICRGDAWNVKTLLYLLAIIAAVAFLEQFTKVLDSALSSTQYKNVVSDYMAAEDDGTNPIRVLFYAIPTIIAFLKRKEIKQCNDDVINFCVNMSIASTGLYIISMVTSGIFMGRLPIYASLFNYILLPWEIKTLFRRESKLITIAVVIVYLLFYYYQMHMTWKIF